jgi:hypothetical protein
MKHRLLLVGLCLAIAIALPISSARGTSVEKMNISDLIGHGDLIVVAKVLALSDGFDGSTGLPYTEVTVTILETLQGNAQGMYSFRQFGLLEPRDMGNGRTYVGVSPDGWPKFEVGQETVLFLYEETSLGFQSTAGLLQGKFDIKGTSVSNGIDNLDLFKDAVADEAMLSDAELKMLQKAHGPVEKSTLLSFVNKAVANGWQN